MKILNLAFVIVIALSSFQLTSAQKPQSISSAGQQKTISADEFGKLEYQARIKLESNDRRVKTVEEIFSGTGSTPIETSTEIYESAFKSSDKMRVVKEIKNASGASSKTGFMMIGRERYSIDESGKWILNPRSGWGGGRGSGSGSATVDTRVYKFIGKSKFQGKPVLIYEVSGKHRTYFNDESVETDETTRYWFSPDGKMLLRQEGTNLYPTLNLRVKKLIVNEYNAQVNIQAPR